MGGKEDEEEPKNIKKEPRNNEDGYDSNDEEAIENRYNQLFSDKDKLPDPSLVTNKKEAFENKFKQMAMDAVSTFEQLKSAFDLPDSLHEDTIAIPNFQDEATSSPTKSSPVKRPPAPKKPTAPKKENGGDPS